MEFNFFAINKSNGIGIYQHYHQSCGTNVFGGYLRARFNRLRENKIALEVAEKEKKTGKDISKSDLRKIKRQFSGNLKFSILVRQENLEEILSEYSRIKAFEYEYSVLTSEHKRGMPLAKYVTKKREKLTFVPESPVAALAVGIVKAIKNLAPKSGRVYALDAFSEDISLNVLNIPDSFGEEEYDDIAGKLHNLDVYDFAKHSVCKDLVKICRSEEYRHIFEANVQ